MHQTAAGCNRFRTAVDGLSPLDLGLVVPVAVIAAVQLFRRSPEGSVLTLVMLVVNVCIGILLMAQGVAQLASGVPMTMGEIVAKMLSFAVLTLVAGGLLVRMAWAASHPTASAQDADPMHTRGT